MLLWIQLVIIDDISIKDNQYYETDGVFCSFNCCLAFVLDNKHNRLYDNSERLLIKIHNKLMNSVNSIINPSPHWKLLKEYGGHLDIDKFRNNFNKIEYIYQGVNKSEICFSPLITLYEEKINF